jgi:hypothetical protein
MAQYQQGAITVTTGDVNVIGVGTAWQANVQTGDMLLVDASGPAAFVAAIVSDGELLLEQPWPGFDAVGVPYAIHRDFDPTTGAPLLAQGDTGLPLVFNRAVAKLSQQTTAAVASAEAIIAARAARDDAQAAAASTAADAAQTIADRTTVVTEKAATIAAKDIAQQAAIDAAAAAIATAADRAAVEAVAGPLADGRVLHVAAVPPGIGVGRDGDMALQTGIDPVLFGPKAGDAWGIGVPLRPTAVPGDLLLTARTLTAAQGWLKTDGAIYQQSAYPALFATLGRLPNAPPPGIKLTAPAVPPAGNGRGISWSPSGRYLAVANDGHPYLAV